MSENQHEAWGSAFVCCIDELNCCLRRHPAANSDRLPRLSWLIRFHHSDTVRILNNPETFSNAISSHLNVPNGMDPPEHAIFQRLTQLELRVPCTKLPGGTSNIEQAEGAAVRAVYPDGFAQLPLSFR